MPVCTNRLYDVLALSFLRFLGENVLKAGLILGKLAVLTHHDMKHVVYKMSSTGIKLIPLERQLLAPKGHC